MSFRIISKITVLLIFLGAGNVASAASVGSGGVSTAFSKDSTSVGVVLGSGSAFNDDYVILGASVGYYVVRGLELGIDVQHWFSGEPSITKVSPQVRYVFTQAKVIKPYVGAFYRRTYFGDINGVDPGDRDSFGYRAGAYFSTDNRVYIGGGIVYEEYQDCGRLSECSTTYPDILFSIRF
ncbi:MAG: hypothetical protein KAT61_07075 [Gammaproteobacteria bacterium]|nr:hypothetical protein [Gammaproteobacteria bacterium]